MAIKYGIDVSEHNGIIDWEEVKASKQVDFVMIRAGYGKTAVDKQFRYNASMCNILGIPIGIYWFSYANTVNDAIKEAKTCLETIKGYKITYPVAFDFEDDSVLVAKNKGVLITKSLATKMAESFLLTIKAKGYIAVNYSNPSYLNQYFEDSLRVSYPLWLAQWPAHPNTSIVPSQNPVIWQYSSTGKVRGIGTDVDLNVCYANYGDVKKEELLMNEDLSMEFLSKVFNFEKQKDWFEKPDDNILEKAKEIGFTDGSRPYEVASRAEVMTMVYRAYIHLRDELERNHLDDWK